MTDRRLIEVAFPLQQTSLDSVHEKSVRHGHISTLHIWPARRPLAACRAVLAATLLPDPGNEEERRALVERLGGRIGENDEGKPETEGGILRWKRESSPDLDSFRNEIRKAYEGRAPRVFDPFSGGGAIPLEAMRLGCEAIAADINPVAWFILKCTLEYPQRLAGQVRRLPEFAWDDPEFRSTWDKGPGKAKAKGRGRKAASAQTIMFSDQGPAEADLSWHVRAWAHWVLAKARADLDRFYPCSIALEHVGTGEIKDETSLAPGIDVMAECKRRNAERKETIKNDVYQWIRRPTVAYLWARTVPCKRCGATIPLLKTRWLCRKAGKQVRLTMRVIDDTKVPGERRVEFGVEANVPTSKGSTTQKHAKDKELAGGTMNRAGVTCPCCNAQLTMEDIRLRGRDGGLGKVLTAVVIDGSSGKEYRLPTPEERSIAESAANEIENIFADLAYGKIDEPINTGSIRKGGVSITRWGITRWGEIFTERQMASLGIFLRHTLAAVDEARKAGYPDEWTEALGCYLAAIFDRLANQSSSVARWHNRGEKVEGTFSRFALPIMWDFAEVNPLGDTTGGYTSALEWVSLALCHLLSGVHRAPVPTVVRQSATRHFLTGVDVVVTDPPYYDAIPYSDVMDFFYVWLRRATFALSSDFSDAFSERLAPKWSRENEDGELIEDESRFGGDRALAKRAYEDGMAKAFSSCCRVLQPDGRLVVVFANKHPDAWETLVAAIIRAGFVVTGSWPIQTEMTTRTRAQTSAALSSSVWLVCRKRPLGARPGFDTTILEEMQKNIQSSLRRFWDAGIRGPDFVWAATGPALEAYSKHPLVKKADRPGEVMTVGEFLEHARRLVVEFVVGRVLSPEGDEEAAAGLDPVTTYWLLHRQTFQLEEVPIGPCILYALSCGLSDRDLAETWDILETRGAARNSDEEDEEEDSDAEAEVDADEGSGGAKIQLKPWDKRTKKGLGETAPGGRPVPIIDRVHRCLHLWKKGELADLDRYVQAQGLHRDALFRRVLQAAIELAPRGSGERELMEALSNHLGVEAMQPQIQLLR